MSGMKTAKRTNERLWQSIKRRVISKEIGGTKAGQWSARKAQIAVKMYKDAGGRYVGPKSRSNSLVRWSAQKWRTRSGKPSHLTGERYLPEKAIQKLSKKQYERTTEAKRRSMRRGQQFSKQPKDIAKITARYR
jgi:hypothetical protein